MLCDEEQERHVGHDIGLGEGDRADRAPVVAIACADRWERRRAEGRCVEAGRRAAWALHPGLGDRTEHTDALLLHRHIAHAERRIALLGASVRGVRRVTPAARSATAATRAFAFAAFSAGDKTEPHNL
eukprot:scaffold10350_cov68-Phaeocystis_antarctica.AAC.6